MFSSVSWQSYISTLTVLLVLYYCVVLYVYYRKDIVQLLTTGRIHHKSELQTTGTNSISAADGYGDEVKALIHQAGYSRLSKDELIFSLQQLLSTDRFDAVQTPDFKEKLSKIITYECQTNCSMHLGEEDLQRVWVGK